MTPGEMPDTGLLPCPACGAVRHHPYVKRASTSWRDKCRSRETPNGHWFETVQAVATCAACRHPWEMERLYAEPDASGAGIYFTWTYDGRVFNEFDRDEPADEPYA